MFLLWFNYKGGDFVDDLNRKYYELDNYKLDNLDNITDSIDYIEESCKNCFHSDGHYCYVKCKYIHSETPTCWSYKDCFTMRTNSDFQDDNDDFYEY